MQSAFRMAWAALLLACPPGFAGAAEGAGLFSADDGVAVPPRQSPGRLLREDAFPESGLGSGALGELASSSELRSRIVAIDLGQLEAAHLATSGGGGTARLRLNLFSDAQFEAAFDRSAPTASGYTLTGRLEGDPLSTVALAANGEWVAGTVWSQQGRYAIVPLGGGVATVRQMDPSAPGRCGVGGGLAEGARGSLPPAADRPAAGRPPGIASLGTTPVPEVFAEDGGDVIDLLVVYPSFARRSMGGHLAMRALIDSDVAMANEAYRVGGAMQRLNLVAAVEARRTPLENRNDGMLEAIRHVDSSSSGYMDEVPRLRDAYAADLVLVHWGHLRVGSLLGIAGVLETLSPEDEEKNGFSVSTSQAFAHELGHNMGLGHPRRDEQIKSNLPFPYSYGYIHEFDPPLGKLRYFGTIMSILQDALPRFSNPRQWYPDESGAPMGVPGEESTQSDDGPADAVRSLNGTRRVVANFRRSASRCRYKLSAQPDSLPASGGKFRIRVEADADCSWNAWSNDGHVSLLDGASGVGDGEVVFRVSANEGWERDVAVFLAGEAHLAEQATAKARGATPVCERAESIRDALVEAAGKPCGEIGAADLAAIRTLNPSVPFSGEPDERRLAPGAFDGLTGLVSLDLSRMGLAGLAPGTFDGLIRLVSLDLRRNSFVELAAGTFDGLPNLVELKLGDNRMLTTLKPGAFRGLPAVEDLFFAGTGLTTLSAGTFEGLSNLLKLDFGVAIDFEDGDCGDPGAPHGGCLIPVHVPLAQVEPGAFRGMSELKTLRLYGNSLTTLEPGVFEGLPNLRKLNLGRNKGLTTLEPGLFDGLSRLDDLFLHQIGLTTLPPGLFDGLSELDGLELSSNQLKTLGPGVFRGLAALEQLILGENQLRALEPGVFDGLAKLDWMYLGDNDLRMLEPGVFDGLFNLRYLNLHANKLTDLPPGLFDGLTELRTVTLYRNNLTTLALGVFDGLTALSTVTLNGNELTELDPALFHGTLNYGRSQMEYLALGDNRLATLDPDLFRGMIHLKRLGLAANRFAKLPPRLFEGLPNFSKLDLRGNPGSPFVFAPQLVRLPGANSAPGGTAQITAEVVQGAPFDLRIPLSVTGGSLSAREVLIRTGAVRGMPISVRPQGGPVTVVAVAPGLPPRCEEWEFWAAHSDPCMYGLKTAAGAPLVLYGLPDQTLPPDGAVKFDLPTAFPGFGEGASYAVESSNPAAVAVSIREGLLIVSAAGGGETTLTVTATSPDGRRETRRFAVTAPAPLAPPEAIDRIPDLSLSAGESVRIDLSGKFRDPDDGSLSYAAETSDSAVATATTEGDALIVAGWAPGVATLTLTATDPDGLSARLSFEVKVAPALRSRWGGWRSVLLKPSSSEGGDEF